MTLEELRAKVQEWDLRITGATPAYYSKILNRLDYHAVREWRVYLPAEHPDFSNSYMERLAKWVGNLTDEKEQMLLLEYAQYISFFSHDDFVALYRTAFDRDITRWIAKQIGARLEPYGGQAMHESIHKDLHQHTWFCPITDSMDINEFYKVNHLRGIGHRPGFATLQMLAERIGTPNPDIAQRIIHYMANPSLDPHNPSQSLKWIVLLEDIVGSGAQCLETIRWAVTNLERPVLFVPLILCPNGVDALHAEEVRSGGRLTVQPVIALRRSDLLGPERQGQTGWSKADNIEDLARRSITRCGLPTNQAFGFKETGCSLATFSNTPDNSLPIIHHKHKGGGWEPLFPRVYRD